MKHLTICFAIAIAVCTICFDSASQSLQRFVFNKFWSQQSGTPDTLNWSATKRDKFRNIFVVGNAMTQTQSTNLLVTKYNPAGQFLWQKTFDGPNHL